MQYLLTKEEFDRLTARAKSDDQIAAENDLRIKAGVELFVMLQKEAKFLEHSSTARLAVSDAFQKFLADCGCSPRDVFQAFNDRPTPIP